MTVTEKYFNVNSDGVSIFCKLYAGDVKKIEKVVLFGHGFSGHKDNRAAARFAGRAISKNKGVALLAFDWPCHGDDVRKTLRLDDCEKYLRLVIDHVRSSFPSARIYAYATSFGGYLFLKYISENENPFEKIALRCPAIPMFDVISKTIMDDADRKKLKNGKPILLGFDRKVRIDGVFIESLRDSEIAERDFTPFSDDIMIIHGTKDEIVPIGAVKAFAERNSIDFESIENADHRFKDPAKMDSAIELIAIWFDMN